MAIAAGRLFSLSVLISLCLATKGPLKSGQDGSKCIDLPGGKAYNGAALQIWDCNGSPDQIWEASIPSGSTTSIQYSADPSKCIDIGGGNLKDGAALQLWDCNGLPQQKFDTRESRPTMPYFSIASHANYDLVIDIPGGKMENGNQLWMWKFANNGNVPTLKSQMWIWVSSADLDQGGNNSLHNVTLQRVIV